MRKWIESRLEELGKTKAELGRHLDLPFARISEIIKEKREVKSSELLPFSQFLQMNPVKVLQLMYGHEGAVDIGDVEPMEKPVVTIPIRGEVAAGLWREVDELNQTNWCEPIGYAPTVYNEHYPEGAQFALRVKGESLNRIAPDGSTLHCVELIDGGSDIKDGDLVIVQRTKYQGSMIEITAKRVRKNGDYELWPESDHPDFQKPLKVRDFQSDDCDEEIRIFAKVINITRKP